MLCFPYISHDSTALCYTEGATLPNTKSGERRISGASGEIITIYFILQILHNVGSVLLQHECVRKVIIPL